MSRTPLEELKKQLIDQPAHALWGFAAGIAPWVGGLAGQAGFYAGVGCLTLSTGIWIGRELWQARDGSHLLWDGAPEWLDPVLDSVVYTLALAGGILVGLLAL